MKRFLLAFFALSALTSFAFAEKGTVLIHPGETIYARFEVKGKKIQLVNASKEKDEGAQVIFTFAQEVAKGMRTLKVENRFPNDLLYKAEMRSLSLKHERRGFRIVRVGKFAPGQGKPGNASRGRKLRVQP